MTYKRLFSDEDVAGINNGPPAPGYHTFKIEEFDEGDFDEKVKVKFTVVGEDVDSDKWILSRFDMESDKSRKWFAKLILAMGVKPTSVIGYKKGRLTWLDDNEKPVSASVIGFFVVGKVVHNPHWNEEKKEQGWVVGNIVEYKPFVDLDGKPCKLSDIAKPVATGGGVPGL